MEKIEVNLDNTAMVDFAECTAKGVAKHFHGLRGMGDNHAADVGNAIHTGLEEWAVGEGKEKVVRKVEEEWDRLASGWAEMPKESRLWKENVKKIVGKFCERRRIEDCPWTVEAVEDVVGVDLVEDNRVKVKYWGKRDLLVRGKGDLLLAPLDHKSTGRVGEWWKRKFKRGSQLQGYMWLTEKLTGEKVSGAWINAIEVKEVPQSEKKCPVHKVKYKECGEEHCVNEMFFFPKNEGRLKEWERGAGELGRMIGIWKRAWGRESQLPWVPRTGMWTGGCVFCEFKEWCDSDFSEQLKGAWVKGEKWEPWKGKEE